MQSYRLYFLDDDGRIRRAVDLECRDDDHALELVEQHADGRPMELWQQARKVRSFEGRP